MVVVGEIDGQADGLVGVAVAGPDMVGQLAFHRSCPHLTHPTKHKLNTKLIRSKTNSFQVQLLVQNQIRFETNNATQNPIHTYILIHGTTSHLGYKTVVMSVVLVVTDGKSGASGYDS